MNIHQEAPFCIDGVDSWIHCIYLDIKASTSKENALPINYHYHDYIEMLYAISTDAYVWQSGEQQRFMSGDLVVINSKEPHTLTFNQPCRYICIKFSPQILYADERALFEFKYVIPFLNQDIHKKVFRREEISRTDIQNLFFEIMSEWEKKDTAYELMIRANILKIIVQLFRHWNLSYNSQQEKYLTKTMKNALSYISQNYSTTNEREVAAWCGLSYSHFSYSFKQLMGKTFNEYLTSIKIKQAENLLITTDNDITSIAYNTGFSTESHFIARFRAYKGITPKQFRNRVRSSGFPNTEKV